MRHWLALSLAVWGAATTPARALATTAAQQGLADHTANRPAVRLAILNFTNVGRDSSLNPLARGLSFLIASGLVRSPGLVVIPQEDLGWSGAGAGATTEAPSDSFFNHIGVDLVLTGSFIEQLEKLRIAGELRDRRTNATTEISPVVVEIGDMYTGVATFVRELKAVMRGKSDAARANRVAILCFTSAPPAWRRDDDFGAELGLSFTLLARPRKVVIVPWLTSKKYCSRSGNRAQVVLDSLGVDGVVTGTFQVSGNVVKVVPTLVVRGVIATLPEIRGETTDLAALEMQLADQVGRLVDATSKGAGQWDVDALRGPRRTPSALLLEARRILATGRDTALAALWVNRAIAAAPANAEARLLLGKILSGQGRHDDAARQISRALDLGGPSVEGYMALGDVYVRQGIFDRALGAFDSALRLSRGRPSPEILRRLGDVHLLTGRPDSAAEYYQRVQQLNPRDTTALNGLGQALRLQGEYEKAADAFQRALAIDSSNVVTRSQLADLYQDLGGEWQRGRRFADAQGAYARAIQLGAGASAFLGKARAFRSLASEARADSLKQRHYRDALEALDEALKRDSTYGQAYVHRGAILLLAEPRRPADALAAYDKAIALGLTDVYRDRSLALLALERFQESLTSLDRAIRSDSTDALSWYFRARLLLNLDREEEALASIDKALTLDPGDARSLLEKARVLRRLRRVDEALSVVREAIQADSLSHEAYTLQGTLLVLTENPAEALISYDRAVLLGANEPHEMRGLALAELGRTDEALKALDQAIRQDPQNVVTRLTRARVLRGARRYDEALRDYAKADSLSPAEPDGLEGRARVLVLMGRADEALPLLDESIRRDSARATTRNTLGMALLDVGRYSEAWDAHRAAAALDSNALEPYALSELAIELEMYEQADRLLKILMGLDSNDSRTLNGMGYLLYRTGQRAEGVRLLERATRLDANSGAALFSLARIAALERRADDALNYLKGAIEREPRYKARAKVASELDPLRKKAQFRRLTST